MPATPAQLQFQGVLSFEEAETKWALSQSSNICGVVITFNAYVIQGSTETLTLCHCSENTQCKGIVRVAGEISSATNVPVLPDANIVAEKRENKEVLEKSTIS